MKEKFKALNKIKRQYKISFEFAKKLKMAIKYQHNRSTAEQFAFLNDLPQNLKIELSMIMHKGIIKKIYFL